MPLDDDAKKTALQQLTTGMVIVGSKGDAGELNAMTANWVVQVAFHPPMVAVGIEKDAHTRKLIDQGKVFSVNVVRAGVDGEGAPLTLEALGWHYGG